MKIKNHIHVLAAARHSEIVDRKGGIDFRRALFCELFHLLYAGVVHFDGIEMYRHNAAEFFVHVPFHAVDHVVRVIDVAVGGNFRMKRNEFAAGAVVVNNEVVDSRNFRVSLDEISDLFDKFRFRGSP